MLSSLLLFAVVGTSQDAPVTLSLRASRLENVVPALAEATGMRLQVAPAIEDLVVIIKVRERPAMRVLELVAEQVGARWVEQDDGTLLLRQFAEDVAARKELQRAGERLALVAELAKLREDVGDGVYTVDDVRKFAAELEKLNRPQEPGTGRSLDGPRLTAPASLLSKQLTLAIGPDALLEIPDGGRRLFSDLPVPGESKLNAAGMRAVEQFWENLELFTRLKNSLIDPKWTKGINADLIALEVPAAGRGKTVLSVTAIRTSLSVWVTVYDAEGSEITSGFHRSLRIASPMKIPARLVSTVKTRHPATEESLLMAKFRLGTYWLDGKLAVGSDEERPLALLLDPEHRDPLSFSVTDCFFAWADELEFDLVAHVPGFYNAYIEELKFQEEIDLAVFWSRLSRLGTMQIDEIDGVMVAGLVSDRHSFRDNGWVKVLGTYRRGTMRYQNRLDAAARFCAAGFENGWKVYHGQMELMRMSMAGLDVIDAGRPGSMLGLAVWHYLPPAKRSAVQPGSWLEGASVHPNVGRILFEEAAGGWSSLSGEMTDLGAHTVQVARNGRLNVSRIEFRVKADTYYTRTQLIPAGDMGMIAMQNNRTISRILAGMSDEQLQAPIVERATPLVPPGRYCGILDRTLRVVLANGAYMDLPVRGQTGPFASTNLSSWDLAKKIARSGGR